MGLMMGKNLSHNLIFHAFLALCRFWEWRKTAKIWQKSRFWPTWSRDRALGYESKKMRKVHLWGDWASSKSQNSQQFSQKLHLKVFHLVMQKNVQKLFAHFFRMTRWKTFKCNFWENGWEFWDFDDTQSPHKWTLRIILDS